MDDESTFDNISEDPRFSVDSQLKLLLDETRDIIDRYIDFDIV